MSALSASRRLHSHDLEEVPLESHDCGTGSAIHHREGRGGAEFVLKHRTLDPVAL